LKVLGFDHGRVSGWATLDCEIVKISEDGEDPKFLPSKIKPQWGSIVSSEEYFPRRLAMMSLKAQQLVSMVCPDVVYIEEGFVGVNRKNSAILLQQRGAIVSGLQKACEHDGLEEPIMINDAPHSSVKKLLTGNGKSSKIDVRRSVCERLEIDINMVSEDEGDALGS
jgi:Holliday junction resolvasome RuvABC endonuclease subunit